jgi:hypothetical protein
MRIVVLRFGLLLGTFLLNACTVLAIADVAVSTTVKLGGAVVGAAIDVTSAGVGVIAGRSGK